MHFAAIEMDSLRHSHSIGVLFINESVLCTNQSHEHFSDYLINLLLAAYAVMM